MSGLVEYGSSDEDEPEVASNSTLKAPEPDANKSSLLSSPRTSHRRNSDSLRHDYATSQNHAPNGSLVGPLVPPTSSASMNATGSAPQSPYSAYRTSVRDLTLPQVPNMDIPPSPPGSPPPGIEKKFERFLELKRQGVHFNERLSKSSALKNPSLLQKLMASAGVTEDYQYNTTFPKSLWDPTAFPPWAFKEELVKSQQKLNEKKEEEKARIFRESIDFISATNSLQSSRGGTPGSAVVIKGSRTSAAERIMAGLDREKTGSPQIQAVRNGRVEVYQQGVSARSPKRRKRSASR